MPNSLLLCHACTVPTIVLIINNPPSCKLVSSTCLPLILHAIKLRAQTPAQRWPSKSKNLRCSLYVDRAVLSRVRLLIVHHLHEAEVTSSKGSTKERTNPIDPVVARELSGANSAAKGSNRVGRSASHEDTYCKLSLVYFIEV